MSDVKKGKQEQTGRYFGLKLHEEIKLGLTIIYDAVINNFTNYQSPFLKCNKLFGVNIVHCKFNNMRM